MKITNYGMNCSDGDYEHDDGNGDYGEDSTDSTDDWYSDENW